MSDSLSVEERGQCVVLAHLLASAAVMRVLGLSCSGLAAVVTMFGSLPTYANWMAVLVLALGVLERYLALRLHFDAGLFAELGRGLELAMLDVALQRLGLRAQAGVPRALWPRMRAALRWYYAHCVCVVLQLGALVLVRGLQ